MKKVRVNFSIPQEIQKKLNSLIRRKDRSAFMAEILDKALEKKLASFKKAYAEAAEDPDRKQLIEDWKITETEGWD